MGTLETFSSRQLTFLVPVLLGFVAVKLSRGFPLRRLPEAWHMRLVAAMVAVMGVINVLSAVTPSLADRLAILEKFSPLEVRHGGHLTAALSGFALLMLARSLARHKRVAWLLALAVLVISAASHMLKGLDYEEAALALGLALILWLMRAHFRARSDRPSVQQGLRVLAGAFLFTLAYGVSGFFLLDRHYRVNFGFFDALRQTAVMFTQFYDPGLTPVTRFGRYFADSIYLVAAATFGYSGLMLLRPVLIRAPATAEERERARRIVVDHGRSCLANFLLLDDKRYLFTPGGSVIGYALVGRTAVALGDPVGPATDLAASIAAFTDLCRRNDWVPVFYQTLPGTLEAYKQAGLDALSVGEEAIVDLERFSLEGRQGKPLRSPVNKLVTAGYRFVVHPPPIPDVLLEELREVSDEWLTTMHGAEMRFSLGWFDDDYVRNSAIGAVYTPEGRISAFVNIVPEYQLNETSVDLMRRRREIANGTMEFLFVSLFQWARAQSFQGFNLGLSSLAGIGGQPDDATFERVIHWIYEHVNQFYNFKGLHAFKDKFHPLWSPRYLVYPGTVNLVQSWIAVVEANSGSGPWPLSLLKRTPPPLRGSPQGASRPGGRA